MTRAIRLITWLDSDPGMFVVMMSIVGFVLIALKLTGWE